MGLTDEYDKKRHEEAYGRGRAKAESVKAGKASSEWLEDGLDRAFGWMVPHGSPEASYRDGYRKEMQSIKADEPEEHTGGGGGGGGGGLGSEILGELLFYLIFLPFIVLFWALVGCVYSLMALFRFKPTTESAKKVSWGLIGIFFVGQFFVAFLSLFGWSIWLALTRPISTIGELLEDCLGLAFEALVVWFSWWLLKLLGRKIRKGVQQGTSGSPDSDTPQLPIAPAASHEILIVARILGAAAIICVLVHNFWKTERAYQGDGKQYPVCTAARDVVANERKPEIKFQLSESCWSGWVTLPPTWSNFHVHDPDYLEFQFRDGKRVRIQPDATQWPGAPPGHVFRLRGPGVAALRTSSKLVCPRIELCRTDYQIDLMISSVEPKPPSHSSLP